MTPAALLVLSCALFGPAPLDIFAPAGDCVLVTQPASGAAEGCFGMLVSEGQPNPESESLWHCEDPGYGARAMAPRDDNFSLTLAEFTGWTWRPFNVPPLATDTDAGLLAPELHATLAALPNHETFAAQTDSSGWALVWSRDFASPDGNYVSADGQGIFVDLVARGVGPGATERVTHSFEVYNPAGGASCGVGVGVLEHRGTGALAVLDGGGCVVDIYARSNGTETWCWRFDLDIVQVSP